MLQVLLPTSTDDEAEQCIPDPSNMSMATQQYLKRYALDQSTTESISNQELQMVDHTPANNLKSILRKGPETQDTGQKAENNQDISIQVLDIARLKELPKLL